MGKGGEAMSTANGVQTTNEYIVSIEGFGDHECSEGGSTDHAERQKKFQQRLMREGITIGTDWFPPSRILKVQRRDVA